MPAAGIAALEHSTSSKGQDTTAAGYFLPAWQNPSSGELVTCTLWHAPTCGRP